MNKKKHETFAAMFDELKLLGGGAAQLDARSILHWAGAGLQKELELAIAAKDIVCGFFHDDAIVILATKSLHDAGGGLTGGTVLGLMTCVQVVSS